MKLTSVKLIGFVSIAILILPFSFALASETNGVIDSTYKYAWSENIGWINFGCDNCNVHITDTEVTGNAWSDSYGWINLNPSGSGVINNNEGALSGQVWGENIGWIDFSGVTIDNSGYFNGHASGNITGSISFNCANNSSCGSSDFKLQTDWRPASIRSNSNGGGGIIQGTFDKPEAPSGGFRIAINNDADTTGSRIVNLSFNAGLNVKKIAISNTSSFIGASQDLYASTRKWDLCSKFAGTVELQNCIEGSHTVYVKFYTRFGRASKVFSDSIIYKKSSKKIGKQGQFVATMNFKRNLRPGDRGKDVKELQRFLNQIDAFRLVNKGPGSPGNETEFFGQLTFDALKKYQQANKEQILKPINLAMATGFFGSSTRFFMNSFIKSSAPKLLIANPKEAKPVLLGVSFKTLRFGMRNNGVKQLQQLLNLKADTQLGKDGLGSPGNETNYFGSLTREAVRRFQSKYSIVSFGDEQTTGYGLVGPKTRAKLKEVLGVE